MFLVHPTRLSKIFADGRTHPCGNARQRQASKLAGHARAKTRMRSPKMKTFEKNLPGRPYSAPAEARAEFCYHSLNEDHSLYTTPPGAQASPHAGHTQTLEIGDSPRISESLQARKPGLATIFVPDLTVFGCWPDFIIRFNSLWGRAALVKVAKKRRCSVGARGDVQGTAGRAPINVRTSGRSTRSKSSMAAPGIRFDGLWNEEARDGWSAAGALGGLGGRAQRAAPRACPAPDLRE